MSATIDHLILNSPYDEPGEFWSYARETRSFSREAGRRKAGYVIATPGATGFDDVGTFVEIPLVNFIRPRVKDWRGRGWPGVTGTTRRLLEHWRNREERTHPFFFCQLEAIETLVWLAEAAESERVGVEIPGDGGPFRRVCSKMATGSGKTIVMAMLIARTLSPGRSRSGCSPTAQAASSRRPTSAKSAPSSTRRKPRNGASVR